MFNISENHTVYGTVAWLVVTDACCMCVICCL